MGPWPHVFMSSSEVMWRDCHFQSQKMS